MRRPLFCVPLCTRSQTVKDLSPGCDFERWPEGPERLTSQSAALTALLTGEPGRPLGRPLRTNHSLRPANCGRHVKQLQAASLYHDVTTWVPCEICSIISQKP